MESRSEITGVRPNEDVEAVGAPGDVKQLVVNSYRSSDMAMLDGLAA